jgi:ADP-ribosyl-[dinitrogen reductase] hydrolase
MMNSMLGALVGDAAGATLEFCGCKVTEEMALNAMTMPGGGRIRVGPGQITDDGELTLTLWRSLNSFETSHIVPILTLMTGYKDWYESCPFDMGRTCSLAFETFYDFFKGQHIHTLQDCKDTIKKVNDGSEANGALMRATAIATWIANKPGADIKMGVECAKEDARLSHPNIVCQEVNAIYVFAIINLLQGRTPNETLQLLDTFIDMEITSEKVKYWYFQESLDVSNMDATRQIGHVRWGFVMALYFLRNPDIGFEEAIKITLMKGGDTDTNAAIVGGMVGAYHNIPDYMLNPVLEFDCTIEGRRHHMRPAEYSVKKVIGHLIQS